LGENEEAGRSSSCQEKGSTHARRPKEAFAANEGALGGKKESWRSSKSFNPEERHANGRWPKEAFRPNEGALGREAESWREIATG
jgi:hypothetical protein